MEYLTEEQLEQYEAIVQIRSGYREEIPELVLELVNFDAWFRYSDSMEVYNHGEELHRNYLQEIALIEDPVLSEACSKALVPSKENLDHIYELYPSLKVRKYIKSSPYDAVAFALNGFSSEHYQIVVGALTELTDCFTGYNHKLPYGVIHTQMIPKFIHLKRISVNPKIQKAIHEFVKTLHRIKLPPLPSLFRIVLDNGWIVNFNYILASEGVSTISLIHEHEQNQSLNIYL